MAYRPPDGASVAYMAHHAGEQGGGGGAKRPFGLTEADLAGLVEQIKQMQRHDPTAKEQWWAYCDGTGGGVRDPARHDAEFMQEFITRFNAGERFELLPTQTTTHSASPTLLNAVKEAQRKSKHWKDAWAGYCDAKGGGKHDPAKHDPSFVIGFLDFAGQQASRALQQLNQTMLADPYGMLTGGAGAPGVMLPHPAQLQALQAQALQQQQQQEQWQQAHEQAQQQAQHEPQQPDAKRQRTGVVASLLSGSGAGCAGGEKGVLVNQVKELQRSGEAVKESWWAFCDQHMGGVRDPARHEIASIRTWLASQGIAATAAPPMASPLSFQAAMGMQAALAAQQAAMGMHAAAATVAASGGELESDALVQRIKAYQRSNQEAKELWWTYCDTLNGGIRDPARHDLTSLVAFIESHGVP